MTASAQTSLVIILLWRCAGFLLFLTCPIMLLVLRFDMHEIKCAAKQRHIPQLPL